MATSMCTQFDLGPVVATPGALEAFQKNGMTGLDLLARHAHGDWGDLSAEEDEPVDDEEDRG